MRIQELSVVAATTPGIPVVRSLVRALKGEILATKSCCRPRCSTRRAAHLPYTRC